MPELKIGNVYTLGSYPQWIRILMSDELFYLYESKDVFGWTLSGYLHTELIFGGGGVDSFFARKPTFVGNEAYSIEQLKIIRPDLPISIFRNKVLTWNTLLEVDEEKLNSILIGNRIEYLATKEIYLCPLGPKGGIQKPILYSSSNGINIQVINLLEFAASLQNKVNPNILNGIGMYRLGVKGKIPTYAISDYYYGNNLIYKRHEEGFDWKKFYNKPK